MVFPRVPLDALPLPCAEWTVGTWDLRDLSGRHVGETLLRDLYVLMLQLVADPPGFVCDDASIPSTIEEIYRRMGARFMRETGGLPVPSTLRSLLDRVCCQVNRVAGAPIGCPPGRRLGDPPHPTSSSTWTNTWFRRFLGEFRLYNEITMTWTGNAVPGWARCDLTTADRFTDSVESLEPQRFAQAVRFIDIPVSDVSL